MKKGMLMISVVFVLAALAVGGVMVGYPKEGYMEETINARYTMICTLNGGYWDDIARGAQEEAERLGVSVKCVSFEESTTEAYEAQLQYAASAGVDGLILSGGLYNAGLIETVNALQAQGMYVVAADAYNEEAGLNATFCSNNMDGGRLAAKALAEATGGKANVLIVTYSMHAMTQIRRMEGFNEALAAYPEMVVVDTIADMGSSILLQTELERVFEEHPEIDAIFCCGASGSEGLGKSPVVRERLGKSIKVVSFDMSETIASYIEEGLYAATIAQATEQMGQYAVRALEACRAGEVYDNEIIHTDLTIVTGENLDAHRIGEGGDVTWNLY